jgi:hypothetical protein
VTSSELILSHRQINQQLVGTTLHQPEEIVQWLAAMQAQEYAMAKWAIGLRLSDPTDATIERAFNEGRILRTHVLRPTWHFITPADIRWITELTAPRVRSAMAYMDRQLEIDRSVVARSQKAFRKALQGGQQLTRAELQAALKAAKVNATGPRFAHLLIHSELDALVCSGPRREKHFTYMLLDERVPPTKALPRETALAELTRRYFASRGPATVQDFSWWSGLSVRDARAGVTMLTDEFTTSVIGGREYVHPSHVTPHRKRIKFTCLLPDYDEYGIAYRDRDAMFRSDHKAGARNPTEIAYNRMIIVDGQIAGSWKRTEEKGEIVVNAVFFAPLPQEKQRALKQAVNRYRAFIGKPVRLVSQVR